MSPPDALPPGVVSDPHTAHVLASYLISGAGLLALSLWAFVSSRHWARRQKAAAAREAAQKERGHE